MRSKIAQRILNRTPKHTHIFIDKYADIVVLISRLLKSKGITQKQLAENLGKKPSEISKWLSGEHNFTLETICKLEAELGETLLVVPKINYHKAYKTEHTLRVTSGYRPTINLAGFEKATINTEKDYDKKAS
jgi:transcriptional regulator with XRE-family HTH domain